MIHKIQNILSNKFLIRFFEKITGTKVFKSIPLGVNPFVDINYYINDINIEIIFDIGANIGQSARFYREKFPNSKIYSIEPVSETYNQLKINTNNLDINCYNLAFGSNEGRVKMAISNIAKHSVSNTIVNNIEENNLNFRCEEVDLTTIDKFLIEKNVKHVNYMKVDTEGYDLEAMKGAENALKNKRIDFIETELSMNSTNQFHIDYFSMVEYMLKYNYLVFGIYEQIHDFVIKKPVLRRSNVVFISQNIFDNRIE